MGSFSIAPFTRGKPFFFNPVRFFHRFLSSFLSSGREKKEREETRKERKEEKEKKEEKREESPVILVFVRQEK